MSPSARRVGPGPWVHRKQNLAVPAKLGQGVEQLTEDHRVPVPASRLSFSHHRIRSFTVFS